MLIQENKNFKEFYEEVFIKELQALFQLIKPLYEAIQNQKEKHDEKPSTLAGSSNEMVDLLKRFENALVLSHIVHINEALDTLMQYNVLIENSLFTSVIVQCKAFDFDQALLTLQALKKEIDYE